MSGKQDEPDASNTVINISVGMSVLRAVVLGYGFACGVALFAFVSVLLTKLSHAVFG